MSKIRTWNQATDFLKIIGDQDLDSDQLQAIRPYVSLFARSAKSGKLPDMDTLKALTDEWAKVEIKYFIDFEKKPFVLDGYEVLPDSEQPSNRMRGVMEFNSSAVMLNFGSQKSSDPMITGYELRDKVTKVTVYGAQLLEFYLTHPQLIPTDWRHLTVVFMGTIYRVSPNEFCPDGLCVRCLKPGCGDTWLRLGLARRSFDSETPVAISYEGRVTS